MASLSEIIAFNTTINVYIDYFTETLYDAELWECKNIATRAKCVTNVEPAEY